MISGVVNGNLEATIRLLIRGPGGQLKKFCGLRHELPLEEHLNDLRERVDHSISTVHELRDQYRNK